MSVRDLREFAEARLAGYEAFLTHNAPTIPSGGGLPSTASIVAFMRTSEKADTIRELLDDYDAEDATS